VREDLADRAKEMGRGNTILSARVNGTYSTTSPTSLLQDRFQLLLYTVP